MKTYFNPPFEVGVLTVTKRKTVKIIDLREKNYGSGK